MSFHIDIWQAIAASVCLCASSMVGLGFIRHVEKSEIQDENREKKLLFLGCCIPVLAMFVATLLLGINLLFFIFSLVLAFCTAVLGLELAKQADYWFQKTFSASPTEIPWKVSVKPFIEGFALEYMVFIALSALYK